jgi:hypothetical protein
MSLLGFDALGRWALAQLPGNGNFALLTIRGAVALAGQAAAFGRSGPGAAASFLAAGSLTGFRLAEQAGQGPFVLAGNAAAFGSSQPSFGGSFLLTGAATNLTVRVVASAGAVSLSGTSLPFFVSLASGRGAFAWAGGDSTYDRDHEAWVRRPFDMMSWQTEAALPPLSWSGVAPAASVWTADVQPANAWTPALIEPEPWTTE